MTVPARDGVAGGVTPFPFTGQVFLEPVRGG
jgi:hypothetical protein